ncbi:hypothetical protein Sps_04156 [Shewanella psychrophila]|uniref:Uncharacterized protein n=1 Tax=Shewanella psychrophila TaxID=225848 RepID=A0A1S6HUV1_9GAMM|nr:hypothetical protein [Shewanella psychrophila]AQS39262.1 hypothetical protein Sps_04156 [Shewanella psychrophila]
MNVAKMGNHRSEVEVSLSNVSVKARASHVDSASNGQQVEESITAVTSSAVNKDSASDHVSISKEGQTALSKALGSQLHGQTAKGKSNTGVAESSRSKSSSGQQLERLQKKLKVTKELLKRSVSDRSDSGKEKSKDLKLQVAQLTIQLAELVKKSSPQTKTS